MEDWLNKISPCIRLVGHHRETDKFLEPLRVIYDHELVLLQGEEFIFEISGRKYICPNNSFIIVPPGETQTARAQPKTSAHRHWIHFDWVYQGSRENTPVLTYLPGRPQNKRFRYKPNFVPDNIFHGPLPQPEKAFDLYHTILDLWIRRSRRNSLLARAKLLELLIEILTGSETSSEAKPRQQDLPGKVRKILDKIADLPINDMPSLQEHLELSGYSYAHLCRSFKAAYGIAPLQYITALRIERAKWLIRQTNLPLGEVSRQVGFGNSAYFCRQFRKHTGQSPSEYGEPS